MSKQRKIHCDLVLERKFNRYFCRAMERDTWALKFYWRTASFLREKRYK